MTSTSNPATKFGKLCNQIGICFRLANYAKSFLLRTLLFPCLLTSRLYYDQEKRPEQVCIHFNESLYQQNAVLTRPKTNLIPYNFARLERVRLWWCICVLFATLFIIKALQCLFTNHLLCCDCICPGKDQWSKRRQRRLLIKKPTVILSSDPPWIINSRLYKTTIIWNLVVCDLRTPNTHMYVTCARTSLWGITKSN